jgi:DNA polymerase
MTALHIDFETRSAVDLRKTGVYVYAEDPTTDVWCAAWAIGDEPVKFWKPHYVNENYPNKKLFDAIRSGMPIVAHNANFERAIFAGIMGPRYGWPQPRADQWRCTMAMALAMSLPPGLGDCSKALGLNVHKDDDGKRLMLQMSKPRKPRASDWVDCSRCSGTGKVYPHDDFNVEDFCPECGGDGQLQPAGLLWWDDAERLEKLYAYCKQDVEVERAIERQLLPLRASEQKLWHLDQAINDRGIHVDTALCHQALQIVDTAAKWLNDELSEITNGEVTKTTAVAQIRSWLATQSVYVDKLDKEELGFLLERELHPSVRRVVEIRQEAAKAAVKKISALLAGTSSDDRARGLLQFHAASTGRWAGRRFQPQNIARPKSENVDGAIGCVGTGSADFVRMVYGEPLAVVSDCLRGMVGAAPGNVLYAADFSNIEGRLIAWLAGEEWKLDAFRDFDRGIGPDIYKLAYARSFGIDPAAVAKDQRQVGKVMELALGYQGGVGAFQKMAVGYGVTVEDERADELKNLWREAHPSVVQFWYDLEHAATDAIRQPGITFHVGRIAFRVAGTFLYMRLPSGRAIVYPFPCIKRKLMPWTKNGVILRGAYTAECNDCEGLHECVACDSTGLIQKPALYAQLPVWKDSVCYKGVDTFTRQWSDQFAHGGLLANNAVQGTARDIEAEAMVRVEVAGYFVTLSVHDEVVSETPEDFGSLEEFEKLMVVLPTWAEGLPLAASGFRDVRYRK